MNERPASEDMPQGSTLTMEHRRSVDKEQVVNELAVKARPAVGRIQIERIRGRRLAGRLYHGACAQRVGPREMRLRGKAMPIAHFEGCKQRIVVPVANAGVNTHTRRELTATTD